MKYLTQASSTPTASLRGQAGALTTTFQYAYDPVGNCTMQTATITSTQVTNYVYDAANRLTSVNGQIYTWDDNGNLVNDGSTLYDYNQANRLISTTVTTTDQHTLFAYNGDGARVQQSVRQINGKDQITLTTHTYLVDIAAPLPVVLQDAIQDSSFVNTSVRYVYGLGTRPVAENHYGYGPSGSWTYLLADALGSVRQIVDADGNVTLAESYEPYGSVLNRVGAASSIFGYAGEQIDTYNQAKRLVQATKSGFQCVEYKCA